MTYPGRDDPGPLSLDGCIRLSHEGSARWRTPHHAVVGTTLLMSIDQFIVSGRVVSALIPFAYSFDRDAVSLRGQHVLQVVQ